MKQSSVFAQRNPRAEREKPEEKSNNMRFSISTACSAHKVTEIPRAVITNFYCVIKYLCQTYSIYLVLRLLCEQYTYPLKTISGVSCYHCCCCRLCSALIFSSCFLPLYLSLSCSLSLLLSHTLHDSAAIFTRSLVLLVRTGRDHNKHSNKVDDWNDYADTRMCVYTDTPCNGEQTKQRYK